MRPVSDIAPSNIRRLLVAEDEWLIVDRIERAFADSKFEIAAKAASVESTLAMLSVARFDAAILDGNLAGERTAAVARQLRAARVPFLLLTASSGTCATATFRWRSSRATRLGRPILTRVRWPCS